MHERRAPRTKRKEEMKKKEYEIGERCPCGGIILADTDSWKVPLCYQCYPDEYEELEQKFKLCIEALSFYAEIEHWGNGGTEIDPCDHEEIAGYGVRGGRKAREVLSIINAND